MWETCNNMIIAWITSNVSPTIKRSIMYMTLVRAIWLNLEKRFALTNGSRKYKLNKEVYETKQNSLSVTEYYTSLKTIWEELDALNVLPTVAAPQPDVVKLLDTINAQREEGRLFQFLNGLSDQFNVQRSQMLMLDHLPSVEAACAVFEQEEAQRAVLNPFKPLLEIMAVNIKTQYQIPTCIVCKGKGHTTERCWMVVGFPKWHSKHNANASAKPRSASFSQSKPVTSRMVVAAQVVDDASSSSGVLFTQRQLEQLALLMPQLQQQVIKESDTDDELDMQFSDSGASDHMTACLNSLHDIVHVAKTHQIKLPTRDSVLITHSGSANVIPVYLINRLSTPLLKYKSPHEIRLKHQPEYQILIIFGCLAFATNPVTTADKFEHRGVPCLFLGYPPFKKGYKLYNLLINEYFISRDVQFNEEIFHFHTSDKTNFMTPIPPSYRPDLSSYEKFDFSNPMSELNSDSTESSPTFSIHSPDPSTSTPHSSVSAEIQPLPPRKSSRAHLPPVWMKDFVTTNNASPISTLENTDISSLFHYFLSTLTSTSDPISFKTVVQK
ncbi:uncharacterized protein LOC141695911 [Apium graveolens]|uniref:uncharacterized protein LOC141695911 n=1 Tax=Apium graveolens TaxID=4045 RepID=UPI003D793219